MKAPAELPVGDRNARRGRDGNGGGNAGDLLVGDAGFLQSQDLFAAPPENKGVAALQTADQLSFPGFFNDFRVDFLLGRGMSAAALAHVYPLRTGRTGAEQLRVDQIVIDQHVAAAELFQPPQGDQIRFPAARANKIYFSGLVIHFAPAPFRQEMRGSCLL